MAHTHPIMSTSMIYAATMNRLIQNDKKQRQENQCHFFLPSKTARS